MSLIAVGRRLMKDVAVYGVGDIATSIVGFLLIPIYTLVLTTDEFGIIAILVTIEAAAKVVLRWGVDAAFMRLYYDCHETAERQTLASTIWIFLFLVNAPVFVAAYALAPTLSASIFGTLAHVSLLRVFFFNTFLLTFTFIPFHVYRIEGRSQWFATLTFSRAFGTALLRLLFIVQLGMGVFGIVAADLLLTGVIFVLISPTILSLFRPRFSQAVLKDALRFGAPRIPHGFAHQVTAMADRWLLLKNDIALGLVGIYGLGVSLGLGMKLFLSAFEYAWAPFYLDTMRRTGAKDIYSRITTYVAAVLALLAAGLAALASDVVRIMAQPDFWDAGRIVPWIALGVVFQGFYQLTAIGLNITKRTATQPVATGCAAAVAVGLNLILIPRVGVMGAAWSYTAAYATMAVVGLAMSQRVYPVQYEWRRLGQLAGAAVVAWVAGRFASMLPLPILLRMFVAGTTVTAVYPTLLWTMGFFRPGELQMLARMRDQLTSVARRSSPGDEAELGGEIADTPSIVDHTDVDAPDAPNLPKRRKVE